MGKVVQIDIRLPDKSELYTIDWITVHVLSSKVPMDGVMNKEEAMHYILDINGRKYLELFS